ncbi:hypothetical protein [Dactylosporangium sp. NPDC048998]|uniref:hypothetical protein n=1 Tax=Dactylosporangium sp. NPDC048998 TaxID=3363976 RepID=UPI00372465CE
MYLLHPLGQQAFIVVLKIGRHLTPRASGQTNFTLIELLRSPRRPDQVCDPGHVVNGVPHRLNGRWATELLQKRLCRRRLIDLDYSLDQRPRPPRLAHGITTA